MSDDNGARRQRRSSSARHQAAHEERFRDIVAGLFEKTVSDAGQEFEVVTKI